MERKTIQVSERTHEIFRREAIRQSKNAAFSIKGVLEKIAERINKKHKYLGEESCAKDAKN